MAKPKEYNTRAQIQRLTELSAIIRELGPKVDSVVETAKQRFMEDIPLYYDEGQRGRLLAIVEQYVPFRSEAEISRITGDSVNDELWALEEAVGDDGTLEDFGREYRRLTSAREERDRIRGGQSRLF